MSHNIRLDITLSKDTSHFDKYIQFVENLDKLADINVISAPKPTYLKPVSKYDECLARFTEQRYFA